MFLDRPGENTKRQRGNTPNQLSRIGLHVSREDAIPENEKTSQGIKIGCITHLSQESIESFDKRKQLIQRSNIPFVSVNDSVFDEEFNFDRFLINDNSTISHLDKDGDFRGDKWIEDTSKSDFTPLFLYENYDIDRDAFQQSGCDVFERIGEYPHDVIRGGNVSMSDIVNVDNYENDQLEDLFIEDTQDSLIVDAYIFARENYLTHTRDVNRQYNDSQILTSSLTGGILLRDYNKRSRSCGFFCSPTYNDKDVKWGTDSLSFIDLKK